jgi:hypothetical protein
VRRKLFAIIQEARPAFGAVLPPMIFVAFAGKIISEDYMMTSINPRWS